jgi:outer membrane protein assembly factor BamB
VISRIISVVLAATLGVVAMAPADAQSMFRGDASRSGVQRDAAPRGFHRVKWTFATGDAVVSSPVWSDGAVIFGSDDGNVYAVDASSGRQRWQFKSGGPVPSTPAVAGSQVFVASYDGKLYALDAATGDLRWKFATEGERRFEAKGLHGMQPRQQTFADPFDVYLSSPVVVGASVYFGSGDGHVYALDTGTGALRWKFRTDNVVHASPAVADGLVYVGSWDGRLYALDAATGAERWRFQAGVDPLMFNQQGFQSSPAVANGIVYVGCRDSNLYALDAKTGQERWRFPTGASWVIVSPAVRDGRVIFATSDSSLYHVVDAASGKPLVEQKAKAYMFSSPTIAGDVVLIGVLNGVLEARDFATGTLLWDYATEAARANQGWALTADRRFNSSMTFRSGWREGMALAFARQSSTGSIFSTPLVVAGVVYFGSTDGRLYAIE